MIVGKSQYAQNPDRMNVPDSRPKRTMPRRAWGYCILTQNHTTDSNASALIVADVIKLIIVNTQNPGHAL
jgi:hypothetical protein